MKKVLITGASGLLGREVMKTFQAASWDTLGLAYTRAGDQLRRVDLKDADAVRNAIQVYQPDVVVHAAAERRTDVVEKEPEAVQQLNVAATGLIAEICAKLGILLVYISTNYVFDGKEPPYKPFDEPHPLNKYGQSKRDGEMATLKYYPGASILRLPLLYGPVERLNESAATYHLDRIRDADTPLILCDYQQRRPTHVRDVAAVLLQMSEIHTQGTTVSGIFHWNTSEQLTRYQMGLIIAEVFGFPTHHIKPNPSLPEAGTPRPHNASMDVSALIDLGVKVTETSFKEGIHESLAPYVN